jgi:beta-phosphoglucomutase family hydrolase
MTVLDDYEAVLFDLDGVLTSTAAQHFAAWKQMFDDFLLRRAQQSGERFRPFEQTDYNLDVDGRPRYDGVRNFLASRGIALPEGTPEDPPEAETVQGLGNRKNELVTAIIGRDGAEVYEGSLRLLRHLRDHGRRTAVVSSSRNCLMILEAVGITDMFDARVDGVIASELGLAGKPAPDTYLEAARRVGVPVEHAVVIEDALSGVEAGRNGAFGLVVGVDRVGQSDALRDHGADLVVTDLAELLRPA